ncbi:hypothetical protein JYT71_01355, partial [Acidimicrobiaceae bacterium AH-315-P05]|nr:hypothetical protein [Acidimicrobiaceae bacterium AH-315-P05]
MGLSSADEIGLDPGRSDDEYDLGLLVVHGIGEQKQGATLIQWSDALANWLRDWTAEDSLAALHQSAKDPRKVAVTRASLHPTDGSPANVTMKVLFPEPDVKDQKWLIAEGWWAGAFQPPSFSELWSWSFSSVPATLSKNANALVGSALRRYAHASGFLRVLEAIRVMALVVLLAVLVLFSPVVLAILTALLIIGGIAQALPFPALRSVVKKAQLIAVGTIGDSQRLIESPTQAGAIKSPVVEGLRWLRSQGCQRVVILAHSQGAAVTYKALVDLSDGLHEDDFEPIDSFISIGSGLPLVHALEHLTSGEASKSLRLASFAVPITAMITAVSWWFLIRRQEYVGVIGMGVIGIATGVALLRIYRGNRARHSASAPAPEAKSRWQLLAPVTLGGKPVASGPLLAAGLAALTWAFIVPDGFAALIAAASATLGLVSIAVIAVDTIPPIENDLAGATFRWIDLYATKDPVPGGATVTTVEGRPESWPVANLGSAAKDHTYYSRNVDECLTYVGIELLEVAGVAIHGEAIRAANANYGFERKWRVGWRSFMSLSLMGAGVLFAINTWGDGDSGLQEWYEAQAYQDSTLDYYLPGGLPNFVPFTLSDGAARAILLVAYIGGGIVLVKAGQALWNIWDRKEARREIGPVAYSEYDIPVQFSVMIAYLVLAVVVAAVPFWLLDTLSEIDITKRSTGLFAILVFAVPLAFGAFLPRVLVGSGIKRYVIGRNKSRSDAMIGFGNYQMARGEVEDAVQTFRRALQTMSDHNRTSPAAHGGLARALDHRSDELRASGQMAAAEAVDVEAAEHFAAATALTGSVSLRTMVDHANFLAASLNEPRKSKRMLASARRMARERRLQPNTGQFLAARIAHFYGAGDECFLGSEPKAERLIRESWATFGRDEQLATSFAMLVALGPSAARSAEWRGHIERILSDGVAAPNIDLRVTLSNLPGSLNALESAE